MAPESTTTISCDYIVEFVDDATATEEKETAVIVLPPQSPALDGETGKTQPPIREA